MCRNIRCDDFFCVYRIYGVGTKHGLIVAKCHVLQWFRCTSHCLTVLHKPHWTANLWFLSPYTPAHETVDWPVGGIRIWTCCCSGIIDTFWVICCNKCLAADCTHCRHYIAQDFGSAWLPSTYSVCPNISFCLFPRVFFQPPSHQKKNLTI